MVRRGLLDLASADRQLCPSTPAVPPLAPPFEGREGCADIFEAASALDQLLQQKAAAPPAGPDYLSFVVAMLTQQLTGMSQLENFHAAVPAVTLAWIEARLLAKEQLLHARRAAAAAPGLAAAASDTTAFMDDGFAFGLALALQVLGQTSSFNAKRWFTAVQAHFTAASQPGATAEQPVSPFPVRLGKWVLSTVGLGSNPATASAAPLVSHTAPSVSQSGVGQLNAIAVSRSESGATVPSLLSLAAQLQQQQPSPHTHTAHLQTAQAKASDAEALHLERTFETAYVLLCPD